MVPRTSGKCSLTEVEGDRCPIWGFRTSWFETTVRGKPYSHYGDVVIIPDGD